MGYQDDVLADYITVLVKNGKHKKVAEHDLHIFLEDDSSSFVSWLWDHLSSNLHLYVKTQESSLYEKPDPNKLLVVERAKENVSHLSIESEHFHKVTVKEAGGRRRRRWEGPTRDESEPPPLRTSELDNYFPKEHGVRSAKSNLNKGHNHHRKRSIIEKNHHIKQKRKKRSVKLKPVVVAPHHALQASRIEKSESRVDAPRRLLQFAIWEALVPKRSPESSRSEPAFKRLRSVVRSATRDESEDGFSPFNVSRPLSKVSVTTAMRCAAEAACNTPTRPRCIMERLDFTSCKELTGYMDQFGSPHSLEPCSGDDRNLQVEFDFPVNRSMLENFKLNEYDIETGSPLNNLDRNMEAYSRCAAEAACNTPTRPRCIMERLDFTSCKELTGYMDQFGSPHSLEPCSDDDRNLQAEFDFRVNRSMLENFKLNEYDIETGSPLNNLDRNMEAYSSFASGNDVYDDAGEGLMDVNQTSYDGDNDSKYGLTPQSELVPMMAQWKKQSCDVIGKPTHNVNITVNVNAGKASHFHLTTHVPKVEEQTILRHKRAFACKTRAQLVQDKEHIVAIDESESPNKDAHKKKMISPSVLGSHSTIQSPNEIGFRSIYVSNVHFGATTDSLCTHFNECGEVQNVVIVVDAATGQPTGSVYVEFVRKESAQLALSLNGTSFMSRILKVVPTSSVPQEVAQTTSWSGFHRPNPYSFVPTPGIPFARAVPGMYARPPLKVGPRSLQWKRNTLSNLNAASTYHIGSAGAPIDAKSFSAAPRRALTYVPGVSDTGRWYLIYSLKVECGQFFLVSRFSFC